MLVVLPDHVWHRTEDGSVALTDGSVPASWGLPRRASLSLSHGSWSVALDLSEDDARWLRDRIGAWLVEARPPDPTTPSP